MNKARLSCGVDVSIDIPTADCPSCPHGPTLLFTRYYADKKPRKFYACSACRDRKDCSFFQWADERVSDEKRNLREQIDAMHHPKTSHDQYTDRLQKFKAQASDKERRFCSSCSEILLPDEWPEHAGHDIKEVQLQQLDMPTELLRPLEDEKTLAQYLFSDNTVQLILDVFRRLRLSHVVCIGSPRIHEHIIKRYGAMKSFLLDIDYRYAQFFPPNSYQRFNMFNFHFFSGDKGRQHLVNFLSTKPSNIVFILDPPFGGIADVLASTVKRLWALATDSVTDPTDGEFPTFWCFPYFLESHVTGAMETLRMLDYKVDYKNHALYKNSKRRGSPVRLFTNVSAENIKLPASEGYRFCKECRRYVAKENKHCTECNSCTSKDGRTYIHCSHCKTCVKPGRVHCTVCGQCLPPAHECTKRDTVTAGCHICGQLDHKRKSCPQVTSRLSPLASVKRKSGHSDNMHNPKKKVKTERKKSTIGPKSKSYRKQKIKAK